MLIVNAKKDLYPENVHINTNNDDIYEFIKYFWKKCIVRKFTKYGYVKNLWIIQVFLVFFKCKILRSLVLLRIYEFTKYFWNCLIMRKFRKSGFAMNLPSTEYFWKYIIVCKCTTYVKNIWTDQVHDFVFLKIFNAA